MSHAANGWKGEFRRNGIRKYRASCPTHFPLHPTRTWVSSQGIEHDIVRPWEGGLCECSQNGPKKQRFGDLFIPARVRRATTLAQEIKLAEQETWENIEEMIALDEAITADMEAHLSHIRLDWAHDMYRWWDDCEEI